MAHAFASGFPGMADNLNGDLGQSSHSDFSQALHNNSAGQGLSSMFANDAQHSLNAASLQHEFGVNGVSGLGSNQQNWHAQQVSMQPSGLNASGTEYDNFLANNGLGVKSQKPQAMPGMPPLSRGSSGVDLLSIGQQNGTAQQRRNPNIQQMFANMTRSPSNGQLAALKPYLPPGLSDEQSFSRDLQAGVPTAALLPQVQNAVGHPPPRSDTRTPPVAPSTQEYNGEPGRDHSRGEWPVSEGNHLVSNTSGLGNAFSGGSNLAPADIQQLLNSMGNYPEQIGRPASRVSNPGGPSRHPSGASLSEVLAAQPKGSPGAASTAQDFPAGSSPSDMDAPPPPKSEPGQEGPPTATNPALEAGPGLSAFAAVANVALEEGAAEGAAGQPPASTVSTMAGQAPLAPNLFDPSYAVPTGNAALNNHLMDPASLAASGNGAAVRAPDLPAGPGGLDMNAMQQLQQQLGGTASYNDIMEAMRLNAQQQALAQQRMQAVRAGSGQGQGGISMANPAVGNMTGMAGYTNQDLVKQADRAGILGRNAMLQQLNKSQMPQQQPVPGRGMASPAGGLPYGMPEQRLPGMDTFGGNTTPKPQPGPQQMRFGGNIGVHAINRAPAAQMPAQPQAQNRAMLGGLGLNNPLTAGLAGTVAGAPRPGLKPNWQAQRVQTHAQAAVAAQQAAQVQQVQAMRLAAAKAQAQAQLNAQLQAQAQAAQAQANRNNLLAGLTPAQLNMLMNAPPQQLNQMASQLGLLDPSPGLAGLGGVPNAGLGGMGMTQQQKLIAAAAAARGGYAPQAPQRQAARPMLSQQQLQQLYAQQAAQQANQQVGRMPPSLLNNLALAGMGGGQPPGGQVPQSQPLGANTRAALVDMGRGLAQAGFTVEQAVNSGLLGGFSAFDVRALSEGHQAEVARMRAARAAAQQNAQATAQQQLAQQHFLRQNQLQQLQQAQQAQANAAAGSHAGSDAGSHGGATPKTPAPIMNLGPGSLGQLFDWQPRQGQQPPASQASTDLLSSNWDLTSTQLQGNQGAAQSHLGPALSLGGISGPMEASLGLGLGPIAPRAGSDAGGSEALFPPSLRSRSPWEGAHGGGAGLGAIQPGSARSGVSSHATTPRSRPGTMSSLLEMGSVFGPPTIKYASQGSLDGELPSHMRGAPGAQAPIGDGRAAKSGQGEVPASLRAFWESGGLGASSASDRSLAKSISLDSARPPASSVAGAQGLPSAGNAMEPAMDLEALDAALEAAANAANAVTDASAPQLQPVAPADHDLYTAASYSFFNMQSPLEDPAEAMGTLSLEGELEGDASTGKDNHNGLMDDTGMSEVAEDKKAV